MNKQEFIISLEERLKTLPQLEKERVLNYYNEALEDAMEDGLSEGEAVESMDDLDEIIKGISEEHVHVIPSKESNKHEDHKRKLRLILVGLTSPFWLTGILLAISLYCVYLCVVLVLGLLLISLILFAVIGLCNVPHTMMLNLASGVVLLGCTFLCIGATPWTYKVFLLCIQESKGLYFKGNNKIKEFWQKAVA